MASAADKFKSTGNGGIPAVATVQTPRTAGATSLIVDTQQYWPLVSGVAFSTYKVDTNNNKVPGTQVDWEAVSDGTDTLSGMVRTGGAIDTGSAVGDKVQMGPTAQWAEDLITGLSNQHSQTDGSHTNITATSIAVSGPATATSVAVTGAVSGATAAVSGKTTTGQLAVAAGTTATVDGSGNITPANQVYTVTALAAGATIQVPSFTPWDGAPVILRMYGAASETLTFAGSYENISGVAYPAATVAGKWLTIGMMYSAAATAWQIISISQSL